MCVCHFLAWSGSHYICDLFFLKHVYLIIRCGHYFSWTTSDLEMKGKCNCSLSHLNLNQIRCFLGIFSNVFRKASNTACFFLWAVVFSMMLLGLWFTRMHPLASSPNHLHFYMYIFFFILLEKYEGTQGQRKQ